MDVRYRFAVLARLRETRSLASSTTPRCTGDHQPISPRNPESFSGIGNTPEEYAAITRPASNSSLKPIRSWSGQDSSGPKM